MSSKPTKKSQPASRPSVDALQYEKLALSTFDLCNRQLSQLNTLITLASSICRNPAITSDERRRQQTMLELLVDTAEQYQRELECDRELYQVIALDAKGIPQSRITANRAARLLAEASQIARQETLASTKPSLSKQTSRSTNVEADATQQSVPVPH
ncbi:hypothetical protein [Paraburkholderia fungorum]|uniref:Uncharacterized protein n=1 Tax=Paraburkholderia fungorum TaxID=134537 RepID=A0A3R7HL16_9BURK|nr:hypothetical protein [Paraburkholderia fungorum]RKF50883.1 hypothetical protein BCY88_01545 [Paraburkholderia fungorum]